MTRHLHKRRDPARRMLAFAAVAAVCMLIVSVPRVSAQSCWTNGEYMITDPGHSGSDYRSSVCWGVQHSGCLGQNTFRVEYSLDGGSTWNSHRSYTMGSSGVAVYEYSADGRDVGPGRSVRWRIYHRWFDVGCSPVDDHEYVPSSSGFSQNTAALKAPSSVWTDAAYSDRDVRIRWSKGTNHPDGASYYRIYRRPNALSSWTQLAEVNGDVRQYVYSTTPGTTAEFGVATVSYVNGTQVSSIVTASGSTQVFNVPGNIDASDDTYAGLIQINWTSTSHYANRYRIYRDGVLIATVPDTARMYEDTEVEDNVFYSYTVRAYSTVGPDSSAAGTANTGRAFPMLPMASDGSFYNRVKVSWSNLSAVADEIKVFRDGEELAVLSSSANAYYDYDAIPGKISWYGVAPVVNGVTFNAASEYGYIRANGRIEGYVQTRTQAGIDSIDVSIFPTPDTLRQARAFDNTDDQLIGVRQAPFGVADSMTIEFWMFKNLSGTGDDFILDKFNGTGFKLWVTGSTLKFQADASTPTSHAVVTSGWNHYAVIVTPTRYRVLRNGSEVATQNGTWAWTETADRVVVGNMRGSATNGLDGTLDDVRIWRGVRPDNLIRMMMQRQLTGGEPGLAVYWPFHNSATRSDFEGDYANGQGFHLRALGTTITTGPDIRPRTYTDVSGFYSIRDLYYSEVSDFAVIPAKPRHGFKPDSLNRTVDINSPTVTTVNFTDTTAFGIEGDVKFAPIAGLDSCAVEGVEIWLNGQFTGAVTDAAGKYAISVPDAGQYTISVRYGDHQFTPASRVLNVSDNVFGLRFTDTTKRVLTVKLHGGSENCLIPIGGGTININALGTGKSQTPSGCLTLTGGVIDVNGNYSIALPAQRYRLEVTSDYAPAGPYKTITRTIDFTRPQNVVSINNTVNPPDTTFVQSNALQRFAYRAQPTMTVEGFPDPVGACAQLVLGQFESYLMRVELNEQYTNSLDPLNPYICPVDSGFVLINYTMSAGNQITDTLRIINGVGYYLGQGSKFAFADVRAVTLGTNGVVVAGANGGAAVFQSTDNGREWSEIGGPLPNKAVRGLAIRSGHLFAATQGGGVYRSTTGGQSWTSYNFGLDNTNVRAIIASTSSMYLATENGVYRFTGVADRWERAATGMTNTDVLSLVMGNGMVYAGTQGGVYESPDGGSSWTQITTGLGSVPVYSLAMNTAGDVYAGTTGGVYRKLSGNNSFSSISTGLPSSAVTALAIRSNGDLFAGTQGDGVYYSTNGGALWVARSAGLPNRNISALVGDANGRMFAGTRGSGVYSSTNGGLRWADASIKGYMLNPGVPNITGGGAHPYQKSYEFTAYTPGYTTQRTFWAVVVGNRQRAPLFVTKTPELPMLILRDPPGDGSSSFWEQGQKITNSYSMKGEYGGSAGVYLDLHCGISSDVPYLGDVGSDVHIVGKAGAGRVNTTDNTVTVEWEAKERISTADNVLGVSTGGDVFMGAAMNIVFSKTDVVDYDTTGCSVLRSEEITWGTRGFATTYVYTETHIRDVLIPLLTSLRDAAVTDSARTSLENDIAVWNQTLQLNDRLKSQATQVKNISFSAGAPYSAEETTTRDSSATISCKIWVEAEAALGLRIYATKANEKEFGVWGNFQWNTGTDSLNIYSNSVTTGYTLNDDDVGDYFSVNVKHDPVYKTPVFQLVAGASSCPWEPGSTPREEPTISIDPTIAIDIPPDEAATFTLTIGNQSQTDEPRYYNLYVTQTSNTEGAIIRVGGVVLEDYLQYYVQPGQTVKATVTVERGPVAYDYNNLEFWITSFCGDWQISDTKRFSVNFLNQCSKATIVEPANNWLVNQANNNKLKIVLTDLEKDKVGDGLRLEYRKIGTTKDWLEAMFIPKNDIVDQKFKLFETEWAIPANVTDGTYEIRVRVNCTTQLGGGTTYSNTVTGTINRTALALFGTPEPRDGILNFGDQIAAVFSNDLDCAEISVANNIELRFLDDSTTIPIDSIRFDCKGNTLVIMPMIQLRRMQNRLVQCTVRDLVDINGNPLAQPVVWSFKVNQNSLIWVTSNASATTFQGAAASVVGTLKNVGGKMESFVLSPTSEWLTPITTSGTLPPMGSQDITFVVSNTLNPGVYTDTVFAHTADGDEPFYIQVNVLHRPPTWQVNPSGWQHNMEVTAQFLIDTTLSTDANDMVAAFVGNECRGLAHIQHVPSLDVHRAFLTVYSDARVQETVTFRVWKASKGKIYHMVETYPFDATASHGTLLNPVILHPQATQQDVPLDRGWNWFSLNTRAAIMTPNAVLSRTLANVGDVLKGQTDYSQYVGGSGWVGSVDTIRIGRAYKIMLANPSSIQVVGNQVPPTTPISVTGGWNWIGYLPMQMLGVNQALNSLIAAPGDRIKGRAGFAEYNSLGLWQGSLSTLSPSQGYLLKSASAGTLTYPNVGNFWPGMPRTPQSAASSFAAVAPTWSVDPTRFEHTMNVTSEIAIDGLVSNDVNDILAAFVGEECRGVAKQVEVDGRVLHFLTAYANTESETLTFRVYHAAGDTTYVASNQLTFTPDDVHGNPLTPYRMRITTSLTSVDASRATAFELEQNYPNPFNPSTTIAFSLPSSEHVTLKVFDMLGTLVATVVDSRLQAGRHTVAFDASTLQSGQYTYQLQAGDYRQTRKMVVLK